MLKVLILCVKDEEIVNGEFFDSRSIKNMKDYLGFVLVVLN